MDACGEVWGFLSFSISAPSLSQPSTILLLPGPCPLSPHPTWDKGHQAAATPASDALAKEWPRGLG